MLILSWVANLTITYKFIKSKIYKEKSEANFFGRQPIFLNEYDGHELKVRQSQDQLKKLFILQTP